MKIYLSNQGNLRNFQNFVRQMDFSEPEKLQITTHDKWITAHPANLVLAAALALKVGKENTEIVGDVPETGRYLDRMGLYKLTKTKSPFHYRKKEAAGRFIPISQIRTPEEQSRFITEMTPLLHLEEEPARTIRYVISELVRNVLEHAWAPNGAIVAAQYYKKTNRVSIGICDTGIGIWKSMNDYWHPRTDLDALHLALTPGISGTTRREGGTAENAGAGLFFIKSIAKTNRNYFTIYSGNAEYTLLKSKYIPKKSLRLESDPAEDEHRESGELPRFDGTLVAVDITLNASQEFDELLDRISDAYDKAIMKRRREKFKEPKFL